MRHIHRYTHSSQKEGTYTDARKKPPQVFQVTRHFCKCGKSKVKRKRTA